MATTIEEKAFFHGLWSSLAALLPMPLCMAFTYGFLGQARTNVGSLPLPTLAITSALGGLIAGMVK